MEIKIEKGIKAPEKRVGGNIKYPFSDMKVGDSFVVNAAKKQSLYLCISKYKRRHKGWDYTTRTIDGDDLRVWRIK